MLSYQHSYHAGNFADVHKHTALVLLLQHLRAKDTPLCYVDSHAGRGLYDLRGPEAQKTREADAGILRLLARAGPVGAASDYLELVRSFNSGDTVDCYPGSAALARSLLRPQDRAILLERHPGEHRALKAAMGRDKRIGIHARDCYEGLPALLPPAIRRGLVLVDPSYEVRSEYEDVAALVIRAMDRWANAVYLIWYPLLAAGRHRLLLERLGQCAPHAMLTSELRIDARPFGMSGSGLVVINTPWGFDEKLDAALDPVVHVLDAAGIGSHTLRWATPA